MHFDNHLAIKKKYIISLCFEINTDEILNAKFKFCLYKPNS